MKNVMSFLFGGGDEGGEAMMMETWVQQEATFQSVGMGQGMSTRASTDQGVSQEVLVTSVTAVL